MLLESSTIVVGSSSRKRTATRVDDQRQLPSYYFKELTQSKKDIFARRVLKCFAGCNIPFRVLSEALRLTASMISMDWSLHDSLRTGSHPPFFALLPLHRIDLMIY
jgi:hypothetical protein